MHLQLILRRYEQSYFIAIDLFKKAMAIAHPTLAVRKSLKQESCAVCEEEKI